MEIFNFVCKNMFYAILLLLFAFIVFCIFAGMIYLLTNYAIYLGIIILPMIIYGGYIAYDEIKDHRPLKDYDGDRYL